MRFEGEQPFGFAAEGFVGPSCDILTHPIGGEMNEALAAGLPVLGSIHSQAVNEMVVDVATG